MGKICPKCGKELRETARFCTSCGTKLEEGMPENPVNTCKCPKWLYKHCDA